MSALRGMLADLTALQRAAERVPELEYQLRQATAERDQWKADALKLGATATATKLLDRDVTRISVEVSNLLMDHAYSPRTMAVELIERVMRELLEHLGAQFGFRP